MEGTGCGSLMPSFTNSGWTRPEGRTCTGATSLRSGPDRRSRRGRATGNVASGNSAVTTIPPYLIRRRAPRRRSLGLRTGSPASIAASRIPAPCSPERLHQGGDRGLVGHDVHPQAELRGGLGGLRTDHAITVTACGLPAMPIRFRTVEDEVNSTASKPPPLIASRIGAGGGAARTVR